MGISGGDQLIYIICKNDSFRNTATDSAPHTIYYLHTGWEISDNRLSGAG
jgi:hypothetical protein